MILLYINLISITLDGWQMFISIFGTFLPVVNVPVSLQKERVLASGLLYQFGNTKGNLFLLSAKAAYGKLAGCCIA